MTSAAARMKAYRQREAAGRVVLTIEVPLIEVADLLIGGKLLQPHHADNRDETRTGSRTPFGNAEPNCSGLKAGDRIDASAEIGSIEGRLSRKGLGQTETELGLCFRPAAREQRIRVKFRGSLSAPAPQSPSDAGCALTTRSYRMLDDDVKRLNANHKPVHRKRRRRRSTDWTKLEFDLAP
jgi:hypothetical protein